MTDLTELAVECQREKMKLEQQVKKANEIIMLYNRLVGELSSTIAKYVLDYYEEYNITREKED